MKRQTLTEKTADELLRYIQEHQLKPGDRIATEADLQKDLGVGRNTIREALRLLMSRGIVTVRQGSGTDISEREGVSEDPLGFSMQSDRKKLTEDLLQTRLILEPPIAALAAQNAGRDDVEKLRVIFQEADARILAHGEYAAQDCAFHVQIARCTHNSVMEKLIPVITNGVMTFAENVRETEYEQTLLSHRAIFKAIEEQRPVDAQRAMEFHVLFNANRYRAEDQ